MAPTQLECMGQGPRELPLAPQAQPRCQRPSGHPTCPRSHQPHCVTSAFWVSLLCRYWVRESQSLSHARASLATQGGLAHALLSAGQGGAATGGPGMGSGMKEASMRLHEDADTVLPSAKASHLPPAPKFTLASVPWLATSQGGGWGDTGRPLFHLRPCG